MKELYSVILRGSYFQVGSYRTFRTFYSLLQDKLHPHLIFSVKFMLKQIRAYNFPISWQGGVPFNTFLSLYFALKAISNSST